MSSKRRNSSKRRGRSRSGARASRHTSAKASAAPIVRMRRHPGVWIAGAVIGILAGSLLGWATQSWQQSREDSDVARRAEAFGGVEVVPGPVDAVRDLLEQDSLLVLDPQLAGRVPDADRQRAEEILAGSPVPARIAYLTYPSTLDAGYTPAGAAAMWRTAVGEVGHYVVLWDTGFYDSGAIGLEDASVTTRTEGQPGPALVRLAEEMTTSEAVPLPTQPDEPGDSDYWGGIGGGLAAALLLGALIVVPLFFLLRWYVGSRRRKVS